jgi:thiamine-monophosphate kinase
MTGQTTPGEFDLIRHYILNATKQRDDVVLGVGDDCALLNIPPGQQLAVSMDTLVAGRHFIPNVDPTSLGHKTLAVNLSDLAAMGATPAWATLSLTLPAAGATWQNWLGQFMQGFQGLAKQYQVQLVGGDTTRGPLSITAQVHGFIEPGQALRRDTAAIGDKIYVSGTLGDAGLALRDQQGQYKLSESERRILIPRLNNPTPRIALGIKLKGLAHAAIDISDGLGADLSHICTASGVGAIIQAQQIPLSETVQHYVQKTAEWNLPVSAGDDYELIFTVPKAQQTAVLQAVHSVSVPIACIGQITADQTVKMILPDGNTHPLGSGYDHFQ